MNLQQIQTADQEMRVIRGDVITRKIWIIDGDAREIDPERLQKFFHGMTVSFSWGTHDNRDGFLAMAILLEMTGDSAFAARYCTVFKSEFIITAEMNKDFEMYLCIAESWIETIRGKHNG